MAIRQTKKIYLKISVVKFKRLCYQKQLNLGGGYRSNVLIKNVVSYFHLDLNILVSFDCECFVIVICVLMLVSKITSVRFRQKKSCQ